RGIPQIEVTFDIDANGILSVSAKDKATGKDQKITIEASSGLDERDIERLVQEAKAHEAEDRARKELIEARNNLDNLVYQVERTLSENVDTLPAAEKEKLDAELASARSALDSDDRATVKAAFDKLTAASHKLAEVMYQSEQSGAAGAGKAAGGRRDDDGDVI